jgi:hypothetical protein
MPTIESSIRVQINGQSLPPISDKLNVDSVETVTVPVKGAPVPAPRKKGKPSKPKPAPTISVQTYKHPNSDVKFVMVYDGGQGGGVRVRVGTSKAELLRQPIILTHAKASAFGQGKLRVVLENDSPAAKVILIAVGSNKPNGAFKESIGKGPKPKG